MDDHGSLHFSMTFVIQKMLHVPYETRFFLGPVLNPLINARHYSKTMLEVITVELQPPPLETNVLAWKTPCDERGSSGQCGSSTD